MNDPVELDDVARRVITDGRHAFDPSELVTARVRRAVEGKLANGTNPPGWQEGRGVPGWSKMLVAGAGACVATAALAYAAWRPTPVAVPPLPAPAKSVAVARAMGQVTTASLVEPEPGALTTPAVSQTPTPATRAPAPSANKAESIAEEVKLLVRVNSAIQSHDGSQALSLLRAYDQQFKKPQLREERAAAGVLALCAAGRIDAARRAAERFQSSWPRSPLAARVVDSCIAGK